MGDEELDSVAVVVYREEGAWRSEVLPERVGADLDGLIDALRQQPCESGAIALVNVADEYFVAVRVRGDEVRVMLSDASAAQSWDLARQVLDRLSTGAPAGRASEKVGVGADEAWANEVWADEVWSDEVWPAGDVGMFADLGLDEMELGAVVGDLDAYADEMLATVARQLGFGEVYDRALEAQVR